MMSQLKNISSSIKQVNLLNSEVCLLNTLHSIEEALHQKFQASAKDSELQKELERRKKALLEKLEALERNPEDPRHMVVEDME